MSFSASRLTCYAMLSAIEDDLRTALIEAFPDGDPRQALTPELLTDATRRYSKDADPSAGLQLAEVLPYVDLGDTLAMLNRHTQRLAPEFRALLPGWRMMLERLLPIRNRVAHTRPLEINDLPFIQDVALELAKNRSCWPNVDETLRRLQIDPTYVLNLDIRFPDVEEEARRHNLPLPDFDDTGLVGRSLSEKQVLQMVRGPYPVISIVGDGGLGKTALALKVAYGLLDDKTRPFDAIVWTTAKAAQLTNTEVSRIEGAIKDSLGMLDAAVRELAGPVEVEDPLSEVLAYMEAFRVLLILDNLETVLDARLRDFLSRLPLNSKVLITSRIGLGSLELPLKLRPLESHDGVILLRATSRARGVDSLVKADQSVLEKFVNKMHSHPLYIKWFVSVVQTGARPEDALADSADFLDFCMSNVYEYLDDAARSALRCLQGLPGKHTQAELAQLTRLPVDELQTALAQLITTNFVTLQPVARGGGISSEYEVTEFAQIYLDRRHPLAYHERANLTKQFEMLLAQGTRLANASVADPYAERSLSVAGPGDFSVAGRLLSALGMDDRGESGQALEQVREAQLLAPEYFETYRIEALIHDKSGDIGRAVDAYERALQHADGSATCLYHAARFFMRRAADPKRGLNLLQEAARTRRNDGVLQMEIVKGHLQCGDAPSAFDGAMGLLRSPIKITRLASISLALRAATAAAQKDLDSGNVAKALERIEEYLDLVLPIIESSDSGLLVRMLQMRALLQRIAKEAKDEYLQRSAVRLEAVISDRFEGEGGLKYARIGRIVSDKGFGFLSVENKSDLFFGRRAVLPTGIFNRLQAGDEVCFIEGKDSTGRRCAVRVQLLED